MPIRLLRQVLFCFNNRGIPGRGSGGGGGGEKSLKAFLALFGVRGLNLEGFEGLRPSKGWGVQRAISTVLKNGKIFIFF